MDGILELILIYYPPGLGDYPLSALGRSPGGSSANQAAMVSSCSYFAHAFY